VTEMLSADEQMQALDALLTTVIPENLKLSEELLGKIPPRAYGFQRSRETFQSRTGPAFDYLAAVETAASLPFEFIFNADRFNRLLTFKARSDSQPGVDAVLDRVTAATWFSPSSNPQDRTIQRIVEMEMLKQLMNLAMNDRAYDEVKAKALAKVKEIKAYADANKHKRTNDDGIYYQYVTSLIDRFLEEPDEFKIPKPIKAPDGSPIGSCDLR